MFFRYGLKNKYNSIIKEAETEAEVIKKNKLLEVKEKFLNKKADLEKEKRMQQAMLSIKKKFGKNAILKGTNLKEGATAKDRNQQIGGHKA